MLAWMINDKARRRRSERMPKQYQTSSMRIISSGSIEGAPCMTVKRRHVLTEHSGIEEVIYAA
jgi:hypothetical protein